MVRRIQQGHRAGVSSGLSLLTPALLRLINGASAATIFGELRRQLPVPAVSGPALFQAYRDHDGPGNIPEDETWRLHMTFLDESAEQKDADYFATACYVEQALPLMATLGWEHNGGFFRTLSANAEAGGDSVHRGMVLGLLLGAGSDHVAKEWKTGLKDHGELVAEIHQFAAIAASKDGHLTL